MTRNPPSGLLVLNGTFYVILQRLTVHNNDSFVTTSRYDTGEQGLSGQ